MFFGWVLSGHGDQETTCSVSTLNISSIPENGLSRFKDLESIGVYEKEVDQGSWWVSGAHHIKKKVYPPLLENRPIAVSGLTRLQKRLERSPALHEGYAKAISWVESHPSITPRLYFFLTYLFGILRVSRKQFWCFHCQLVPDGVCFWPSWIFHGMGVGRKTLHIRRCIIPIKLIEVPI